MFLRALALGVTCLVALPLQPQDEKALVYIYRPRQYVGAVKEPIIYMDGEKLAKMDNGRYFAVRVAPGEHQFQGNIKETGIVLDAKQGQTYYLRFAIEMGAWSGKYPVSLVRPEQADKELRMMQPLSRNKAISKEVILDQIQFK